MSKTEVKAGDDFTIDIPVTNTGQAKGKETVLGFVTCKYASLTRPAKELRFFAKKEIAGGATVNYHFDLNALHNLGFVDESGNDVLEAGIYTITIGNKTIDITVRQ